MPKTILIVDDDPDLSHIIKSLLEKNGYAVLSAEDGSRALKLLKTETPDMIITDLTMPVMSGWQFSMKVRQDERFKKIPIIILSGLVEYEKKGEDFESGTIYLGKPFEIPHLLDKVQSLLK